MEQPGDKMLSENYLRVWPNPELLEVKLQVGWIESLYEVSLYYCGRERMGEKKEEKSKDRRKGRIMN